jgi:large subunit ribosomal protein L22
MTIDLIRGKSVNDARAILANTNTKSSRLIEKVLNSAAANAVNNLGLDEDELFISACYVNPGQTIKRIQFGSRGRVNRHDHRTSHIVVKVSDGKTTEKEAK